MQDKTLKDLNDWVSVKTEGMIDPFLEHFNNPAALRLFLINAIYFNGKWTMPFSPDDTSPCIFNGLNSSKAVDTMHMYKESYRYYNDNGIQGIEIPYGNESLVMNILIPQDKEKTTIGELYDQLTTDQFSRYLQQLDEANKVEVATLAFPKFKMEYGMVELKDTLQALGMKDAFNGETADFNLINDSLFVSAVMHKAKIEVEEWGTKAAAATAIEMRTTGIEVNDPFVFIVDVPFVYIIRDKQTNTILFMGQMNDME
jgi:serpin B